MNFDPYFEWYDLNGRVIFKAKYIDRHLNLAPIAVWYLNLPNDQLDMLRVHTRRWHGKMFVFHPNLSAWTFTFCVLVLLYFLKLCGSHIFTLFPTLLQFSIQHSKRSIRHFWDNTHTDPQENHLCTTLVLLKPPFQLPLFTILPPCTTATPPWMPHETSHKTYKMFSLVSPSSPKTQHT